MTDEKRSSNGCRFSQSCKVTGCHVLCQTKSPTGTGDAGVPMFEPNVKRWSKVLKNVTYHGTAFAIASCVKAGSESMNARRGIRRYSSRQNHEPPNRSRYKSASAQNRL